MQLFGGLSKYFPDSDQPISPLLVGGDKSNFDTFGDAFLVMFQILTGENWNNPLYDVMSAMPSLKEGLFGTLIAFIFMSLTYSILHYIILNLIVAVILENFELEEEEKKIRQVTSYMSQNDLIAKTFFSRFLRYKLKAIFAYELFKFDLCF